MLKIDARGLPPIPWGRPSQHAVGEWVATLGMEELPLALGVVSVPPRRIPPIGGQLGVRIVGESEAKIEEVAPNSPAQSAGLKPNDVIVQINGKPVRNEAELRATLGQYKPGTPVKLVVKRGDKRLEIGATLGTIRNAGTQRRDAQNLGGAGVSRRYDDFPRVLQHDTVVAPNDCGGPLVDIDGHCVGVNIARALRVASYALPSRVVQETVEKLREGER